MKLFTFEGKTTFTRAFSIQIPANTYEQAEEKALQLLEDVEDFQYYDVVPQKIQIDIQEHTEE